MLRNVFTKTLRDQAPALLWWGSGLVSLALMVIFFYPSIRDQPALNEFLQNAPEALMRAFVGDITDLTSPEGYLNSQLFFFLVPLLLLIYAIGFGAGAIAGEEERGTLDLLLSTPLARKQVLIDKFAVLAVTTLLLGLLLWLGLAAGVLALDAEDVEIDLGRLAAVTLGGVLLALAFGSLALALGSATGRRGVSAAITSALAVGAYFLNAFAPLVETLEPLQRLSPFYYYIGADPLAHGLNLEHAALLLGLIGVFFGLGLLAFQRRDLGV